jgi:lysophospholipase L1-like esterase
MTNIRLTPPSGITSMQANGRTYTCAQGSSISVPDFDAAVLMSNGWTVVNASLLTVLAANVPSTAYQGAGVVLQDENGVVYSWSGSVYEPASISANNTPPMLPVGSRRLPIALANVLQQPGYVNRAGVAGDSISSGITAAPVHANHAGITESLVASNGGLNGALCSTCVLFTGAVRTCATGNGTLTYNPTTNTLTWAANGDTAGTPVVCDRTKPVKLSSGTPGNEIYVTIRPKLGTANKLPGVLTTDTSINVGAVGNGYFPVLHSVAACYADWLRADLHGSYEIVGKWAESGNCTNNIVDQLPEIVASGIDELFLMVGTNDPGNGLTTAQTQANFQTIFQTLNNAGIKVSVISITPRGDAANQSYILGMNRWLSEYCQDPTNPRHLLQYIDLYQQLCSSTVAYASGAPYDINTAMFRADDLHPGDLGGMTISAGIAAVKKDKTLPVRYEHPNQLYDATNNPYGNLITNPQMLVGSTRPGTVAGGKTPGTGTINGTVPDDYTVWNQSGSNVVTVSSPSRSSIDASDTTPGNWCQLAFSTTFGGVTTLYIPFTLANIALLALYEFGFDFAVDNPSLLTRFDAQLMFNGADRISCGQYNGENWSVGAAPTTFTRRFWKSPRWMTPSSWAWAGQGGNPTPTQLRVNINPSAACNVYLGNFYFRRIRS